MISKGKQNFYPGAFSRSTGDLQSIGFPVKKPDPLVDVYQSDTFVRSFISVQRKLKRVKFVFFHSPSVILHENMKDIIAG